MLLNKEEIHLLRQTAETFSSGSSEPIHAILHRNIYLIFTTAAGHIEISKGTRKFLIAFDQYLGKDKINRWKKRSVIFPFKGNGFCFIAFHRSDTDNPMICCVRIKNSKIFYIRIEKYPVWDFSTAVMKYFEHLPLPSNNC